MQSERGPLWPPGAGASGVCRAAYHARWLRWPPRQHGIVGIRVNGIDMIAWDSEGLIAGFKVMVRPRIRAWSPFP